MRSVISVKERLLSNIIKINDCWIWTAATDQKGYGRMHVLTAAGRVYGRAHRISHEVFKGPIPEGHDVMHSCDTPSCINPDHLSTGTRSDNMKDAAAKRRIRTIGKANLTHCPQGHEYTPENTYVRTNGHRRCKTCSNALAREYHSRKIAAAIRKGEPT